MSEMKEKRPFKVVYTIVERKDSKKGIWYRIGTAWVNHDQSLNVKLDAHPTNGQLHIRDYEPYENGKRVGTSPESTTYEFAAADGRLS